MSLVPAAASGAQIGTIAVPESPAVDLFQPDTGAIPDIRLDTSTTITRESLSNLESAVQETLHSFVFDSAASTWSCYNPVQATSLATTDGGVIITAPGGDLVFKLAGVGRDGAIATAGAGEVSAEDRLLSIERPGYAEWYQNNDEAIMQGMDIAERPDGEGSLIVRFDLSGSLTPSMENQALLFSNEDGSVVSYQNLRAWDSAGRMLPAAMELDGKTLAWKVDDELAVYPVTIDPEFVQKQVEYGPLAGDLFGFSVSVSGNYAVVGALLGKNILSTVPMAGAAYFYKTDDGGETWVMKQAEYGSIALENFGISVSASGDYAIIGAPGNDTVRSGAAEAGAAYFYKTENSGETWVMKQAEYGRHAGDSFGDSVSVSGNYAVVGASWNDTICSGADDAGAAYFYETENSGETWVMKQAEYGKHTDDGFGDSVSVSGNNAVIGADWNDTVCSGRAAAGAVYFYKTVNGDNWVMKQAEYGKHDDDGFGYSVSVSGNYAVVGASWNDTIRFGADEAGAAYFYRTGDSGETWVMEQAEYGSLAYDGFGYSVSVSDEYAVVGAPGNNTIRTGGVGDAGAAYFYGTADGGETWDMREAEYGQNSNDCLGWSVSVSGNYAVVGAAWNETVRPTPLGGPGAGAAYFYLLSPSIDARTPANGAAGVAINANLVADFDQNVAAVGGKNIRIYKAGDTLVQTIAANSAAVTVAGNTVTINPDAFAYSTGYYVLIDAGAFRSTATNIPFGGIAAKTTWAFTTGAAPANPAAEGGDNDDGGDSGPATSTGVGVSESVLAGDTAKIRINGGDDVVSRVDVTVRSDASSVMALVRGLSYLPSGVASPDSKSYEYVDISILKIDSSDISSGVIYFSVLKSWLDANSIEPRDVVLRHYNEETGEWEDLPTEIVETAGGYVYYRATTPGFSYFEIGISEGAAAGKSPAESAEATVAITTTPRATATAATIATVIPAAGSAAGTSGDLPAAGIIIAAIVILIVAAAGIAIHKRRQEEYPDWWHEEED